MSIYGDSEIELLLEPQRKWNALTDEERIRATMLLFNQGEPVTKPEKEAPPPAEKDPFDGLVVGRIVHYHPFPHESYNAKTGGPWAAIVTAVGESGVVTLNVQIPKSRPVGQDPVERFEKVSYGDGEGCWSWMFDGQGSRYKPDRPA